MKSKKLSFGFYTSHRATRLCRFLASPLRGDTAIGMVLHDGEPSSELQRLCDKNAIPLICVDYKKLGIDKKQRSSYVSGILLDELTTRKVDYCFSFGAHLLVGKLLDIYRNRIINFHPSLLPAFPGIKAVDQAINYGALLIGNTAHFIDEGVDTGAIIMQSFLTRKEYSGYDSVLDLQLTMLAQIIKWLEEDRVKIKGRTVQIRDACFARDCFIPNIEFELTEIK